jgi:hypothetical protein
MKGMNQAETGVKTVYFIRGRKPYVPRRSTNPNRAVMTAVGHMQINQYGAHLCEVYNAETGERYAAIKRSVTGRLTIDYDYDTRAKETRYSLAFVLGL